MIAKGWAVDELAADDVESAKTFSCRRGAERMQVVVFRDGAAAAQTMILAVKD
jgi:hypothetical protein